VTTIPNNVPAKVRLTTTPQTISFFTHDFSLEFFPFQRPTFFQAEMVLSFSTNPYNNYYAANSKEFISLDKAAKQDFRPGTRYDLLPGNADSFAVDLKKYAKHYGCSFLLNIPSTRAVNATNVNAFFYSDQVHMLETWNQVTDANIAINANKIWGTRD
jgi:hypothetical protein